MAERTTQPRVTMYTTTWCGDCRRSKRLMDAHHVSYDEINIEHSPEAMREVMRINNGYRSVPTIVIEGGPTLVEPSDRALAQALGIEAGQSPARV
jgi:mycoredoxin